MEGPASQDLTSAWKEGEVWGRGAIVQTENGGHVWGPERDSGGPREQGRGGPAGCPACRANTLHPHVPIGCFTWCLHQRPLCGDAHGNDLFSQERTMDLTVLQPSPQSSFICTISPVQPAVDLPGRDEGE